jgi:hypothetical protein
MVENKEVRYFVRMSAREKTRAARNISQNPLAIKRLTIVIPVHLS